MNITDPHVAPLLGMTDCRDSSTRKTALELPTYYKRTQESAIVPKGYFRKTGETLTKLFKNLMTNCNFLQTEPEENKEKLVYI